MRYPCDAIPQSDGGQVPEQMHSGWILSATILGSSMAFIDGTVVNVALPNLQASLSATVAELQWVVEAYALFLAALILIGGKIGDLYGRKRMFAAGVVIFAAASAFCGFAPRIHALIGARAVQGAGAALLVPGSLSILGASFAPAKRGKAIGTWSGFTGITTAIGPVLGGWLVQHFSWRWVFFLNLPIAFAVLLITFWRVPESRAAAADQRLDLPGALLTTIGLGTLVFAMIEAPELGWRSPYVLVGLATGILSLVALVPIESKSRFPLIPFTLFRSADFSGANLVTLLLYAALGVVLFFLPLDLIQVHGYTATEAGAANLPFILILFLLSRWSGGLAGRYGAKWPLVGGALVSGLGFMLFALPGIRGSYWSTFFPAMVVLGLGMSAVVAPLTTTVMNAVGEEQLGAASGINNAVSRVASLLSIALLGLVVLQVFSTRLERRLATAQIPRQTQQAILAQRNRLLQIELPSTLTAAQRQSITRAIDESFVAAFRRVLLVCAGLAVLSAASAWGLIGAKRDHKRQLAD